MRGSGQGCEFSLSEYQDGQDTKLPKVRTQHVNIMFWSNKYGTKPPNWRLGWAEGLASFHQGSSSLSLLTVSSCKWAHEQELAALLSALLLYNGRKQWCLVHLNWCQCKEQQEKKEQYSLLPVFLYLLGILLTDTQSNLELGLFIHLHGGRWLGSSRECYFVCFFKAPCVQRCLRGASSVKRQPVLNTIYAISSPPHP